MGIENDRSSDNFENKDDDLEYKFSDELYSVIGADEEEENMDGYYFEDEDTYSDDFDEDEYDAEEDENEAEF